MAPTVTSFNASTSFLADDRVPRIQDGLLQWFAKNARDLPWRRTRDPYAILVSEVMLQQTQVDRVLPYYERFLARFPTVQDLAKAPAAEVIRIWSGLGYNRRAVNLQRAARMVVAEFGGVFSDDAKTLQSLPGIGSYTAGAIAAFAFERDVTFLDTNMRRVVNRVVFGSDTVKDPHVLEAARILMPHGQSWTWNQALIEFGALQCTARRPACVICPLQRDCRAFPTIQTSLGHTPASQSTLKTARFETTSRYFRGRIVEALRDLPDAEDAGIELSQLGAFVKDEFAREDLPWLRELVEGLQRDGLAVISEDSPSYDALGSAGPLRTRVRLP